MPEKDILTELSKDPLYRQTAAATDELIGSDFVERMNQHERIKAEEDNDISKARSIRSTVPNGAPVNVPNGPVFNTPPSKVLIPEDSVEQRSRDYQQQIAGALRNTNAWVDKSKNWSKPYGFNTGVSDVDFDRYYASDRVFKKLGYSPFRDNDALYNANSSWWDDFNRMRSQYVPLAGEAFVETFKQWNHPFDFSANTKFSADYEKRMKIAHSSRGGIGGSAINLMGNSAYTIGTMSQMIMEGIAVATASSVLTATGIGAPGAAMLGGAYIARTASKLRRMYGLLEGVKDVEKAASVLQPTMTAFSSIDNIEKARSLWAGAKGIGSTALKNVANMPLGLETVKFGKDFITAKNGVDKLNDFALMRKGVGSLYMDIRELNFAVSESRMEGGSVTNNIINDRTQEYYLKHGKMPEGADADHIAEIAFKAGNKTSLINTPTIYLTNKLVFGKAFRGFTPSAVVRRELGEAGSDLIIDETRRGTGKAVAEIVKGPKKYLMTNYWKQAPLGAATNLLRYTQANWTEGAQESIQSVIAEATEKYYNDVFDNPAMIGNRQAWAAFEGGVKGQFNGQGAETFLSGFLMGALVGPVQNAVYNKGWKAVERMKDPTEFARIKQEQEERTNMVVNAINKMDPKQYFNALETNMATQVSLDKVMNEAEQNNDPKGFHNAKGDSMFNHFNALRETGNLDYFIDRLKDLKNLSPDELQELSNNAPVANNFNKSQDMYQRIDAVVARAEEIKVRSKEVNDRFTDDPDIFQVSKAKSPAEYRQLLIKMEAYKQAKKHAIYASYGFDDALRRMSSIMDDVATINRPLAKTDSSRFNILFSKSQTNDEIDILRQEAKIYETGTLDQKKKARVAEKKLEKLEKLSADKDHYAELYKASKKEKGSKKSRADLNEALKDFKKSYYEYVKFYGSESGEFVIDSKIEPSFIGIRDYVQLADDSEDFGRSINALHDPKNFYDVVDRLEVVAQRVYDNAAKTSLAAFEKYKDREDEHGLLNSIFNAGAFIDPNSVEDLKKGNLEDIKFFYVAEGHGEITPDSAYYKDKILPILKQFKLYKEEVRGQKEGIDDGSDKDGAKKPSQKEVVSDFEKALKKNNEFVVGVDKTHYSIKNPTTDVVEKAKRVSRVIPDDYTGPEDAGKVAIIAGSHVDRMGRQFFIDGGKLEYNKTYTSPDGEKWSPKDGILKEGSKNKEGGISKEAFPKVLEGLQKRYQKYVIDGKMKILTTDSVLYDITKEKKVAGAVDIFAVSEDGKISIFDFKTMKKGYYRRYDISTPYKGKDKLTKREQHTNQLSAYSILLSNQYGIQHDSLKVIPFELIYDDEGYIEDVKNQPDIDLDYNKEIEKLIPRDTPYVEQDKDKKKKSKIKETELEGKITITHIEDKVNKGDVKSIVQTQAYHDTFYNNDGVYKTKSNNYVQIDYRGEVELKGIRVVGVNGFKFNMSKDAFAKHQGFTTWKEFAKGRYGAKALANGETVNLYDIRTVDPKEIGLEDEEPVLGDIVYVTAGNEIVNMVANDPDVAINGDVLLQKYMQTIPEIKVSGNLNDVEDTFLEYYMSQDTSEEKAKIKAEIQSIFIKAAKPGKTVLTRNWFAREIATEATIITDKDLLVQLFKEHGRKDPEKAADYALRMEKQGSFKKARPGMVTFLDREGLRKTPSTTSKKINKKISQIYDKILTKIESTPPHKLDDMWTEFIDTDEFNKISLAQSRNLEFLIKERKRGTKKGIIFSDLKDGQIVRTKKNKILRVIFVGKTKVKLINVKDKYAVPFSISGDKVPKVIVSIIERKTVAAKKKAKAEKEKKKEEDTEGITEEEEDENIEDDETPEDMTDEEKAENEQTIKDLLYDEDEIEETEDSAVQKTKKPEVSIKNAKAGFKNPQTAQSKFTDHLIGCKKTKKTKK